MRMSRYKLYFHFSCVACLSPEEEGNVHKHFSHMKNQNFTSQRWDRKHETKHVMIGFTFIFHCTIIYIYCIYSLNCLWQQIKSDIHVKFILIKLYKNCLLWENTATPQIFIPEDRQMDGSMAGEETLELSCTALRGLRLFFRFLRHFTTARGKSKSSSWSKQ